MKKPILFLLLITLQTTLSTSCKKEYNYYNTITDDDYCRLEGRWLRIESNFSSNDNMVVSVNPDELGGVIEVEPTDPQGIFLKGKVKWKDIRRQSHDTFTMHDLTADVFGAGRREALMACISPDTLRIAVKGNGSWQLWVRK